MRMTDAILPGHTSLGTIKGSVNHVCSLSLPLLLAGSKLRPADTRDNIFLSISGQFQQQTGTFHLKRAHFNICSSASFRRPFPGQSFLPPKPNGPQSIWLSTKFLHSHLQLSSILFNSRHKEKLPLKLSLNYKIENHQYQHLDYSFNISFNITRGNRTLPRQLPFMLKWYYHLPSC